jgi:hypothetical protein
MENSLSSSTQPNGQLVIKSLMLPWPAVPILTTRDSAEDLHLRRGDTEIHRQERDSESGLDNFGTAGDDRGGRTQGDRRDIFHSSPHSRRFFSACGDSSSFLPAPFRPPFLYLSEDKPLTTYYLTNTKNVL